MRTSLKTTLLSLAAAVSITASAGVAFAQTATSQTGIVTINIQSILSDSLAAKSAKQQIDAKRNEYQSELKKLESNLLKEQQAIKEQRATLSPDALNAKAKEFDQKMTDAQKTQQDKRERLAVANNQALGEIQEALMKIVPSVAQSKGAKVVVPTSNLLYATPDLDITKEVLGQLDKNMPSVKVSFTAPAAPKAN